MTEKDTGADNGSAAPKWTLSRLLEPIYVFLGISTKSLPETVLSRLHERRQFMSEAMGEGKSLDSGAAVVLQAGAVRTAEAEKQISAAAPEAVLGAVEYRLAITDVFVEKAQYHLSNRASRYKTLGYSMYALAILVFALGAYKAFDRLSAHDNPECKPRSACVESAAAPAVPPSPVVSAVPAGTTNASAQAPADAHSATDNTDRWIDLLRGFILAFTAYGFIVVTAVALSRGARACLDQRERLLTKRHSLRQGRLFLHLMGGRVTIEDLERAFNWNHEQYNAFTHMPTDAKAPWGNVLEEVVKIVPDLVKAGVSATKVAEEKMSAADDKKQSATTPPGHA